MILRGEDACHLPISDYCHQFSWEPVCLEKDLVMVRAGNFTASYHIQYLFEDGLGINVEMAIPESAFLGRTGIKGTPRYLLHGLAL